MSQLQHADVTVSKRSQPVTTTDLSVCRFFVFFDDFLRLLDRWLRPPWSAPYNTQILISTTATICSMNRN